MNENASLKIWQMLQPMVRKEIAKGTESSVKSKKMVVTTAFNASTNTVGVTEAFGKEIQVPVAGTINPNSLTVGAAVWVIALHGSWSNAMVWMLGDGETGYHFMSDVLMKVYPVGSVYVSVNNVSPAVLFGGTWEQIKDRFLLAAGSTYSAGTTGGEATHKLTTSEMPSHTHTFTGTAASHTHRVQVYSNNNANFTMATAGLRFSGVSWLEAGNTTAGSTGGDNAGVTESTSVTPKGTNSNTGSGTAHNNMPPYLAVYMWKRTA